jgi:hypothetical protein
MHVATGPGKVTVLTRPAEAADAGLSASLHNFDIDDATVKAEHRRFLDADVVPLLKANQRAVAFLRGTASKSGTAAHDRALSERRVNAVAEFLVSKGVGKAQIVTTFSGKDLSVSKLNEDEADRAVFVLLESAGPPSRVRLAHVNPARPQDGFQDGRPDPLNGIQPGLLLAFGVLAQRSSLAVGDPVAPNTPAPAPPVNPLQPPPPFLLVTRGKTNSFRVQGGKGMKVTSDKPEVGKVVSPSSGVLNDDDQVVDIFGGIEGNASIDVRDSQGRRFQNVIAVTVEPLTVEVAFSYLTSPAGVATNRTPGSEAAILNEVNVIYNKQTGIFFTSASVNPSVAIPEFGSAKDVVLDTSLPRGKHTPDWDKIYPPHRDPKGNLNVFFVRNIKNLGPGFPGGVTEVVRTTAQFRDCIIDNRDNNKLVQSDGVNMAHEAGHSLGEFHNGDPRSLMSGNPAVGLFIFPDMAFRMRKNLKAFPKK